MKTTSYIAVALACFVANSISAPTPALKDGLPGITGILGSITEPSAGDGNKIIGNGQNNGNGNGNGNAAGNGNGDGNSAGNGNQGGNGNSINFGMKERGMVSDLTGGLKGGVNGVVGSITHPSAGNGNTIDGNGVGNGNGNGNGNSAGNGNGNGNSAGNGNEAGNGNSINVGDVTLPDVELPDIDLSPSINLARSSE